MGQRKLKLEVEVERERIESLWWISQLVWRIFCHQRGILAISCEGCATVPLKNPARRSLCHGSFKKVYATVCKDVQDSMVG